MSFWQSLLKCVNIAILLYAVLAHVSRELTLPRSNKTRSNVPEAFILDFDGTITKTDTIDAIFNGAMDVQGQRGIDMSRAWQEIIVNYFREYDAHARNYEPREDDRHTAEQEIEFYQSLRAVEERSFSRISSSGIFSGIDEQKWEDIGSQALSKGDVAVRMGFEDFLVPIKKAKAKWSIVSVNFSKAFIRGVLGSNVGPGSNVSVFANQPTEDGVLKGPWGGVVMATSDDKFNVMPSLMGWRDGKTRGKTVYIGDSGTDIECLLADGIIGIVISDDEWSHLLKMMRRIGMRTLHIEEYEEKTRAIYWARNYLEIVQSPLMAQDAGIVRNH